MVKFKIKQFRIGLAFVLFLGNLVNAQQEESLRVQLWKLVLDEDDLMAYSVQEFLDTKAWEEWEDWSDTANTEIVIDDSYNGYLQVNREYLQTTVGAYKDKNGRYAILQNRRYRYYNRSLSSNSILVDLLPNGFGITDFITKTTDVSTKGYSCFYLEADIPRKGTDTQINLKLIPLGLMRRGSALAFEFSEYGDDNLFLYDFLHDLVKKISDKTTLSHVLDRNFDAISSGDKEIIDDFIGDDKGGHFENIEDLSKLLIHLNSVYQLNSAITYKSVILGWNRVEGRFFIKDRIENDTKKLSFKQFLENAEYYTAIQ